MSVFNLNSFRKSAKRFRVAWFDLEPHVENFFGHGVPTNSRDEKKFSSSEVPPRWGGTSGAARNKPRQDPKTS